jgi:hypothetical protein
VGGAYCARGIRETLRKVRAKLLGSVKLLKYNEIYFCRPTVQTGFARRFLPRLYAFCRADRAPDDMACELRRIAGTHRG